MTLLHERGGGGSRNCFLMFQCPKIKIVKIVLKFCNKHQNMAKILLNFIPDQKMAHFFEKKFYFQGGSKRLPLPIHKHRKIPGTIGLKSWKPPKMLIHIEEGVDLSVHLKWGLNHKLLTVGRAIIHPKVKILLLRQ